MRIAVSAPALDAGLVARLDSVTVTPAAVRTGRSCSRSKPVDVVMVLVTRPAVAKLIVRVA